MNDLSWRTLPARIAVLLICAPVFTHCSSSEPKLDRVPARDYAAVIDVVARLRDLPWRQRITLAADARADIDVPPSGIYYGAPTAHSERAYKTIGLLSPAEDLAKAFDEFTRLAALVRYDPARAHAAWSPVAEQIGASLTRMDTRAAGDFAAALATVRALQEQHFAWRASLERAATEDRRLALAALAAGDALLTVLSRAGDHGPPNFKIADASADELDRLSRHLPVFLRRQLSFPYRHGARFVYWAYRSNGWRGVNALYAKPPLATAEIHQPEQYFLRREMPLRFFPAQLLRRFKQPAMVEQTLGQEMIAGLLAGARRTPLSEDIAAGWRGDHLFHFTETGKPATLWFTAWQNDRGAEEFFGAYRAALQLRHGVRFDLKVRRTIAEARSRDQQWLLQRNASLVLLVAGAPGDDLESLAADAWTDLEIDREAVELRFESARTNSQWSPSSR